VAVVIVRERICQFLIMTSLQTSAGYYRACLSTTYMDDISSPIFLRQVAPYVEKSETLRKCANSHSPSITYKTVC